MASFICTAETPWTPDKGTPAIHPDAIEGEQRDGWPAGDIVEFHCPHCGLDFERELSQ